VSTAWQDWFNNFMLASNQLQFISPADNVDCNLLKGRLGNIHIDLYYLKIHKWIIIRGSKNRSCLSK
jgi:hypothetical protein